MLTGLDGVRRAVGRHLGYSEWVVVTPERVETFLRATGRGPATLRIGDAAPPLLILSLSNMLLPQVVEVRGFAAGVNTGTDRVRFPAPVPVGGRVRAGVRLVSVDERPRGLDTVMTIRIELDDGGGAGAEIESRSRWLT